MKPTAHSILMNIQEVPSPVTDVAQFFAEITEAYIHFQETILHLEQKIPTSSPQQILEGCEKIRQKQNNLAILDEQMIDIINLVGKEIVHEVIVRDYRRAFACANKASKNLYEKLKALKCSLDEKHSPLFSETYL